MGLFRTKINEQIHYMSKLTLEQKMLFEKQKFTITEINPDYALVRFLASFGMTAYTLEEWAAASSPPIPLKNKSLSFRAKRGIPLKNANADYGINEKWGDRR